MEEKRINDWVDINDRAPNNEERERNHDGVIGSQFIVMIKGAEMPTALYLTDDGRWTDGKYNHNTGDFNWFNIIAWREFPTFPADWKGGAA